MAKAKPKARAKPGPKPTEAGPMKFRAVMPCHEPMLLWISETAKDRKLTVPSLLELALIAYARANGVKPPPPR